jgi:dual specificity phosphatase 12
VDWVTETIAIGNYLEARDAELLRRNRIRSALSLDRTLQDTSPATLGLAAIEAVPLDDGPGNDLRLFERAVSALVSLCNLHAPVLVQCHAGRSRSAVVVAGYLMKTRGIDSGEALALIAAKREIKVTAGLERLLETFE